MGLSSGFYSSVSGLNASGSGLSVIGNNIANINTAGFKSGRSLFGDIFNASLKEDSSSQIGGGVNFASVETQFAQGTIVSSSNPFDFAIEGEGFFAVRDSVKDAEYFTRAGMFSLDEESYFVNPNGLRLQGYMADAAGTITTTLADLQIPRDANNETIMPPEPTATASLQVNLNSNDDVPTAAWAVDPLEGPAVESYNYVTSLSVYDDYYLYDTTNNSINVNPAHKVDIYFVKTANYSTATGREWNVYAVWDYAKVTDAQPDHDYREQLLGSLFFGQMDPTDPADPDGVLKTQTIAPVNLSWHADWGGAAQTVAVDFDDSTQYGIANSTRFQQTDGYTAGGLTDFRMDQGGVLYGIYSNAEERAMAQLAVAKFNAPQELAKKGNNLYAETTESGEWRAAGIGPNDEVKVFSQSLEMSNIDLATEFVNMIALQRAFQANATTMRTTNEMLIKLTEI